MSESLPYTDMAKYLYSLARRDYESRRILNSREDAWPAFLSLALGLGQEKVVLVKVHQHHAPDKLFVQALTRTQRITATIGDADGSAVVVAPLYLDSIKITPQWYRLDDNDWTVQGFEIEPTSKDVDYSLGVSYHVKPFQQEDLDWIEERLELLKEMIR